MTTEEEFIPTIAVGRFSGDLKGMAPGKANSMFSDLLSRISVECGRLGVIGHNKANFKCGDDLLSVSCTTDDGNVRSKVEFASPVGEYTGVMNVIVYGAGFEALEDAIYRCAEAVPGMKTEVIRDFRGNKFPADA